MSEIKYTSDGKKVIIVGKLNAQQTIVQEIFVSAGQEIPSGENFVVTSLHDQPAESWKEKNLRELEARYEKEKVRWDNEIKEMNRKMSTAKDKAKEMASAMFSFSGKADSEKLGTLKAFLAGDITHLYNKNRREIITWGDDAIYDIDSWGGTRKIDGIKLLSLFGKSDGDLSFRLHAYRDGSGGSEEIIPCGSYEEALAFAQADCNAQAEKYAGDEKCNWFPLESWAKISGLVIPEAAKEKHARIGRIETEKRIANLTKEIENLTASITTTNP